jgi:hypothetical protein
MTCGSTSVPITVAKKDYSSDPSIKKAWEVIRVALQDALAVTIFGYSAPASDRDAVSIMQEAWGSPEKRQFESFEIIDVKPREEVRANWVGFVYSDHYRTYTNFRDSILVRHPRRSGEAFLNQYTDDKFLEGNSVIEAKTLDELHDWFRPLTSMSRTVSTSQLKFSHHKHSTAPCYRFARIATSPATGAGRLQLPS